MDKSVVEWAEHAARLLAEITADCESPIERMLLTYIVMHASEEAVEVATRGGRLRLGKEIAGSFRITPQAAIGNFRADILVEYNPDGDEEMRGARVVVECDGHEFHEKTREQAARDKERQNWLIGHGYLVLRYSGSQIVRDASKCALEVVCLAGNSELP